ncbi:MAG: T9SS type A sorting domain-containing protein [Ignavibacteria bacterium]|nr:T9SS type A sorting domain-containing protein [Ignavibacteria bacterium]
MQDATIEGNTALPVELASFTATTNRNAVSLNWSTATETNNAGFDVERKAATGTEWTKVGNVTGNGTTSEVRNYTFTDRANTGTYNYRLKQLDVNGNFEYFNLSNEIEVGVPNSFDMSQNYPNPFNPSTKINYDLPVDGNVSIVLYDLTGRQVASIVNEVKTAGYYTVSFNASNLASGMYFYRISASNFVSTKKMVLVK